MRVYVTANPTEVDQLPTGTASSIAEQLRGGPEAGRTFTLKADGAVLSPLDRVPSDAKVIEVIEHVSILGTPPAYAEGGDIVTIEVTLPDED